MAGREHAVYTQRNNVLGTLNVLHAMAKHVPDAHLVKPVVPNDALSGVTVRSTLRASPAGSFAPHNTRREPPRP